MLEKCLRNLCQMDVTDFTELNCDNQNPCGCRLCFQNKMECGILGFSVLEDSFARFYFRNPTVPRL